MTISLYETEGGGSGRQPRRAVGIEERVDDRAIGYGVAAALSGHRLEHPLQPPQIGNLAADFADMIARQLLDLSARIGAAVDETEQLAYFLDRETEVAASPDEVEPSDEALSVKRCPPALRGGGGSRLTRS